MTFGSLKSKFVEELTELYPKNEILSFFYLLIEHRLGFTKAEQHLQRDRTLEKTHYDFLSHALAELKLQKPIQYIIGVTEFFNFPFRVDKNVLIPRPETEELVTWVIEQAEKEKKSSLTILDIGTGCGCIAISLAKNLPNATVYALDVSVLALEVAKKNATLNEVDVAFIESNVLNSEAFSGRFQDLNFDIIVSNPPYVRTSEKAKMRTNVLQYEPGIALFVNDKSPLIFYEAIAHFASKKLKPSGELFFEINQYLGKETQNLLDQNGFFNVVLRKDLFGNDRMIKASF